MWCVIIPLVKQFLECGKIVNTHGLHGELKVVPWCDSPDFICTLSRVFLSGQEFVVSSARVHGTLVILKLSGIDDINSAISLKNKVLMFDRSDVTLEPGEFYIQDAIGLPVYTEDGIEVGQLIDIIQSPVSDVYVVKGDNQEHLIPNVPEFVKSVDLSYGITVSLIEGM